MKKLKLSLIVAFVAMASIVGAQSASLNIKGGLNMSNFFSSELNDKNMKPGFHVGVGADLEFLQNISLQTGLFFSTKGAKYTFDIPIADGNIEYSTSANYLQLPIHLAYKIDVTPGTKVVFHAGPYIAYGLNGKRKITTGWKPGYEIELGPKDANTFDKDFGVMKRFDAGVGLGVGAEFGNILVDLGWDMGLIDVSKVNSYNIKNQNAYLSVGYKF